MLAADKLQLQSQLKQQATALKEKEFNLHHSNLMTVGTQAAVLAGLDITMFIEFNPPVDTEWGMERLHIARALKCIYYAIIVSAFCANIIVVAHTTVLSVLGAGMALRGPDGSMMTATDGLYEERQSVFRVFGLGLTLTVGSVLISVWLLLRWEAAIICWFIALYTCHRMYLNYRRVSRRFDYDESLTVDFNDIMDGPAAIRGVSTSTSPRYFRTSQQTSRQMQTPERARRSVPTKKSPKVNYHSKGVARSDSSSSRTFESDDDFENQRLVPSNGRSNLNSRQRRISSPIQMV